jgi:hypothetical protein
MPDKRQSYNGCVSHGCRWPRHNRKAKPAAVTLVGQLPVTNSCYARCMRELAALVVLLSFACSSSTTSKDSAVPFEAGVSAPNLTLDADLPFVTDAGQCAEILKMSVPIELGVDAGSCESRPTVPCNSGNLAMADLANHCGGLPVETSFIATFSQGCADHLYLSPTLSDNPVVACLARALEASHFACADQDPCLGYGYSTLS